MKIACRNLGVSCPNRKLQLFHAFSVMVQKHWMSPSLQQSDDMNGRVEFGIVSHQCLHKTQHGHHFGGLSAVSVFPASVSSGTTTSILSPSGDSTSKTSSSKKIFRASLLIAVEGESDGFSGGRSPWLLSFVSCLTGSSDRTLSCLGGRPTEIHLRLLAFWTLKSQRLPASVSSGTTTSILSPSGDFTSKTSPAPVV